MAGELLTRGHGAARRFVESCIEREAAPHAVLFVGAARVGKRTLAEDLAAGLLCLAQDPRERPCRRCLACRKLARGDHPDLHRLAPEGPGGQIRIGNREGPEPGTVRGLVRELALLPVEGRFRIAIVDGADRMNEDAQNAFLKTLEEPPAGVVLVLCADDEERLLPTVRSRCTRIRLGTVPAPEVAALLEERGLADAARASAVARLAGGRPGIALALAVRPEYELTLARLTRTLLDLLPAGRRSRLGAASGLLADGATLARLVADLDADAASPPPVADGETDREAAEGPVRTLASPAEKRRAVVAILEAWRDLARDLAVAARDGRAALRTMELLEEVEAAAAALPPGAMEAHLARLDETIGLVAANANPELALDVLLLAWPRPAEAAA